MNNAHEWSYSTHRVICTPVTQSDVDDIALLYRSEHVMQMIAPPCNDDDATAIAARCVKVTRHKSADCFWSLYLKDTHEWLGIMGLLQQKTDNSIAEMGIMLLPGIGVKGIATEVIAGMLPVAFNDMGYTQIFSEYRREHIAIQRIADKLGFLSIAPRSNDDVLIKSACRLNKADWLQEIPYNFHT